MPKMKTKQAAAKRFKVTGSGKILRRRAGLRHKLEKRAPSSKKHAGKAALVHEGDYYRISRAIPHNL